MAVSFKCPHCSKLLRSANPPAPGKKVKCPACGEPFLPKVEPEKSTAIQKKPKAPPPPPDDEDDEDEDRPRRKSPPPKKASRRARDDDDDDEDEDEEEERPRRRGRTDDDDDEDEDEDDRPRRKKAAQQKSKLPWILGLVGGLLLLAGVAVVVVMMRPTAKTAGQAKAPPAINPLAYIPADTNIVFGLNAGELSKKNKLDDLLSLSDKAVPNEADRAQIEAQKQVLRDTDRMVAGTTASAKPRSVVVFLTRGPLNQEDTKKIFGADPARDVAGIKVYKVRPTSKKDTASQWAALPEDRLLVMGEQPEKDFDALLLAAKQAPAHPAAELIGQVQAAHAWVVIAFTGEVQKKLQDDVLPNMAKMMPKLSSMVPIMQKSRGLLLKVDWLDPGALKVQLGLACGSDADAGQVKTNLEQFWVGEGKNLLQQAGPLLAAMAAPPKAAPKGKKPAPAPPQGPNIQEVITDITLSFRVEQAGSVAWASLQVSEAALKPPAAPAPKAAGQ